MNIQICCIRWDGYPITRSIREVLYSISQDLYKLKIPYIEFDLGWCKGEVFTEWQILEIEKTVGCVFYSTIYVGNKKTIIEYLAEEYFEEKYEIEFLINQAIVGTEFGYICRN
ncbi:MAG: hypothetical protein KBD26_03560 [Candidatus Pacebacteria bacterium]|nr:hypothetical protein [Candidatus Paceibacterota bacterium]MBP9772882.1 hypothetical protein [Candidatus Paceibacterota bacterium]QQR76374.1 MAG: hypothetical protein IPJ63_02630 [Candidatus Nomurabacteria bacterium]